MGIKIGFVLLTHQNPLQIHRLVATLNTMFNRPPIVCHHDFGQCSLDTADFPANVTFIRPHLATLWGDFSVVEATVRCLQVMFSAPAAPDWFILLSGADYPIKPAQQIIGDIAASPYDAHIHHRLIDPANLSHWWDKLCCQRYHTVLLAPFLPRRWHRLRTRLRLPAGLARPLTPFSAEFRCYAGGAWFLTNARTVAHIIHSFQTNPKLNRHYRRATLADESYFQTMLANAPGLRLSNNVYRYTDWSAGGRHPKTLTLTDLPNLQASTAHFARKFDLNRDSAILDELDQLILNPA